MENRKKRISESENRSIDFYNHGKIPPQAVDFEEVVIGACLMEQEIVVTVMQILQPEHFYKEANQIIFNAILTLFKANEPIDILTVSQELKKTEQLELAGGAFYIAQLTNRVASTTNTETHARVIQQKFIAREAIRISTNLSSDLFDDADVFEPLGNAITEFNNLQESISRKKAVHVADIIAIEERKRENVQVMGLATGISLLDKTIMGYCEPDLIIVAGRPGMGKSAFAFCNMLAMGEMGVPCALFSQEMSTEQVVARFVTAKAEVNSERYRRRELSDYEWLRVREAFAKIKKMPIYIDDTPALTIVEIKAKATVLKIKHGIKAIFVDYLQLMSGQGNNRESIISEISRGLKALAKELKVPVIALSQLNRSVESRNDKRPTLADLRESGAIEQDADVVMFLYRPDYYNKDVDANGDKIPLRNPDGSIIPENYAQLIIDKNRNGKVDIIPVKWTGEFTKYSDWQYQQVESMAEPF